jgi:hypothetical protein
MLTMESNDVSNVDNNEPAAAAARQEYLDFLNQLPFNSIFGWSDEFCQVLCNVLSQSNRIEIRRLLATATIQRVPILLSPADREIQRLQSGFKAKFQNQDVIIKVCTNEIKCTYAAIMGVIMHTLFEQIVGVSAPKIYRYGYVYAALDENDQDDKHPDEEVLLAFGYPTIVSSPLQGKEIKTFTDLETTAFLQHTAAILMQLHTKYHFSHRDLHFDNMRFMYDHGGQYSVEIFDFDASCFKWPGLSEGFQFLVAGYHTSNERIWFISSNAVENNQCEKSHYLDLLDLVISVTQFQHEDIVTQFQRATGYEFPCLALCDDKIPERDLSVDENCVLATSWLYDVTGCAFHCAEETKKRILQIVCEDEGEKMLTSMILV